MSKITKSSFWMSFCLAASVGVISPAVQATTAQELDSGALLRARTCKALEDSVGDKLAGMRVLFELAKAMPTEEQKDIIYQMNSENTGILMEVVNIALANTCDPSKSAIPAVNFTTEVMEYSKKF